MIATAGDIDWKKFDAIFEHCLTLWPRSVQLSAARDAKGERLGFAAWDFDSQIDGPYVGRRDHKHIVRMMLWAMFCALPRESFDGAFELAKLDREKVREKFDHDVRSEHDAGSASPEEREYFQQNII